MPQFQRDARVRVPHHLHHRLNQRDRGIPSPMVVHWRGYVNHRNEDLFLGIRNYSRTDALRNLRDPGPVHSKNGNEIPRILLHHSDDSSQREDACGGVSPVQNPLRAEVGAVRSSQGCHTGGKI